MRVTVREFFDGARVFCLVDGRCAGDGGTNFFVWLTAVTVMATVTHRRWRWRWREKRKW